MMVVIGIIAILGAVVVPGFKKAYSDYKMMDTINKVDTLASAMRSCYLVFNKTIRQDSSGFAFVDPRMLVFVQGGGGKETDNRYGHLYRRLLFPQMTLTFWSNDPWCSVGDFYIQIQTRGNKPLGYDKFLNKLTKGGCTTEERGDWLYIYLPERENYPFSIVSPYIGNRKIQIIPVYSLNFSNFHESQIFFKKN